MQATDVKQNRTVSQRTSDPVTPSSYLESITIVVPGSNDEELIHADYDSAFWTESAVGKFVVPYYRSLTQGLISEKGLAEFGSNEKACIVIHRPATRIECRYAKGDSESMEARAFKTERVPTLTWDTPSANAEVLAEIAEHADGIRGEDLELIRDSGKLILRKQEAGRSQPAILNVRTEKGNAQRRELSQISCKAKDAPPRSLMGEFDSVFWTPAAVEKFLIPYYAYQRLGADAAAQLLQAFITDDRIIAVGHRPPTRYDTLRAEVDSSLLFWKETPGVTREAELVPLTLQVYLKDYR